MLEGQAGLREWVGPWINKKIKYKLNKYKYKLISINFLGHTQEKRGEEIYHLVSYISMERYQ